MSNIFSELDSIVQVGLIGVVAIGAYWLYNELSSSGVIGGVESAVGGVENAVGTAIGSVNTTELGADVGGALNVIGTGVGVAEHVATEAERLADTGLRVVDTGIGWATSIVDSIFGFTEPANYGKPGVRSIDIINNIPRVPSLKFQ